MPTSWNVPCALETPHVGSPTELHPSLVPCINVLYSPRDHLLYSYCRFILLSLAVDTLARTSQNGDLLTLLQFLSSLQRNLLKLARPQVTSAYSMICGCADWVQMLEVSMVASCSAATMSDTRAWAKARRRRYLVNELPSWTTASGLFLIRQLI